MSTPRRITQRDIARLAGVSQATVSLVLNNRTDLGVRIAPETRERVLSVIRETGYVADPIARRMVDRRNRIVGVFTYEPVFPTATRDFYHPFLVGIEEAAERLGSDLLLFTSTPVVDGRRRILHEDNRLRLADGSVLLGRHMDPEDLSRLVADGYPIVAVGRRDDDAVPYVGADYATATAALVHEARALGHRVFAYVGPGTGAESSADRLRGFHDAVENPDPQPTNPNSAPTATPGPTATSGAAVIGSAVPSAAAATGSATPAAAVTGFAAADSTAANSAATGSIGTRGFASVGDAIHTTDVSASALDALLDAGVTALFVEEPADAVALVGIARQRGLRIPDDLSILTLGDPVRPIDGAAADRLDFTGFSIPRREMGWQAVEVLTAVLEGETSDIRRLLPCSRVAGSTLARRPAAD